MVIRKFPIFLFMCLALGGLISCAEGGTLQPKSEVQVKEAQEIIGGIQVEEIEPESEFAVMLLNPEFGELCSGVLIHPQVVLTAAHCVSKGSESAKVFFSVNPLQGENEARLIVKRIVHPHYSSEDPMTSIDLALLVLDQQAPSTHRPVMFARNGLLKKGEELLLLGYGQTSFLEKEGIGVLRKVHAQVALSSFNFIEVDQSQGRGICRGDSGGPVFTRKGSLPLLIGIAKLDYDKHKEGAIECLGTAQITRVNSDSIRRWIKNNLAELGFRP